MIHFLSLLQSPSATTEAELLEGGQAASSFDFKALATPSWWTELAVEFGPKILMSIAILVIGRMLSKLVVAGVRRALRARDTDETLTKFLASVLSMVLTALVLITALDPLGIESTSFIAIMSAATLAIGFALQDSLSSFAAGIMLILFRPFEVGDYIEGGGTQGIVEEITIFRTILRTPDNKQIIVPNASLSTDLITNYSAKPTRRVDMVFGCGYDDDLLQAKAILKEIIAADERVLAEPESNIFVLELADNSVNFAVRPWVKSEDYWGLWGDFHEAVKLRFDAEGLSIPYPQRDVHLHAVSESSVAIG